MPLAEVWLSHIRASSAFFEAFRHPITPVEYAAVTFAATFPSSTALHTRPCRLHPHTDGSSYVRPWLSPWNHTAIFPIRSRFGPLRTLPPEFAKKKLSAFFSFAIASYFCQISNARSLNARQYAGVPGGGSLLQIAQWHSGRLPSGGHPFA